MVKLSATWLCAALAVAAPAIAEPTAALTVSGCEFGDIYASEPASCELTFANNDDRIIKISNFRFVNEHGTARPGELEIAPGTTARVKVSVDTGKSVGRNSYIVLFDSSPKSTYRSTKVKGFVRTALEEPTPLLDFHVVDLRGNIERSHVVTLSSKEVSDFRLLRVVESAPWIAASIVDDGKKLSLAIKDDAPWGLQEGYVRIAMNTPNQPEAIVKVKADIHGEIVPDQNPVDFGIMRAGNRNEALIRVIDRSSRPLKLGKIEVKGFKGSVSVLPCMPKTANCRMLRVRISDKQQIGSLKGELVVDLPGYHRSLPVYTWGLLVPKNYKIPSINETIARQEATQAKDLASQLKIATKESKPMDLPPPPGNGPLLKWVVSDAGTVYGFEIFRSDSEAGPYLLLNRDLIHAQTENDDQQAFQWRDTTAKAGSTYYYSIGIVRVNGKKEPLIERQKVTAK